MLSVFQIVNTTRGRKQVSIALPSRQITFSGKSIYFVKAARSRHYILGKLARDSLQKGVSSVSKGGLCVTSLLPWLN
jgi:hypothetical protein